MCIIIDIEKKKKKNKTRMNRFERYEIWVSSWIGYLCCQNRTIRRKKRNTGFKVSYVRLPMYFSRLPTYHPEKAFTSVPELPTPSATNFNGCITQEGNYTTTNLGVDGVELLSQICKKNGVCNKKNFGSTKPETK